MPASLRPIYINGRFLTHRVTGVERYAIETVLEMDEIAGREGIAVEVLVPPGIAELPSYRHLKIRQVGSVGGHLWEQAVLPFYSRRGVLFTPAGGAPLVHRRNVVTIHDAAVYSMPAGFSLSFTLWYRFVYSCLARTARQIIAISQFSKDEIVKHFGAAPEDVTVAYESGAHINRVVPQPEVIARNGLQAGSYALAVSSRNPNKNFTAILSLAPVMRQHGLRLVIAGGSNSKVFKGPDIEDRDATMLGYVTDGELRSLYENAACFVFPSLYEGFGLPPMEALAMGCPVVVSNTNALGEVYAEIGFLCDPLNLDDVARQTVLAARSRTDTTDRCRSFAHGFTWRQAAETVWQQLKLAQGRA